MADMAGLFQALGAGVSTTANTAINMKELERRAEENAKRLRISMERLDIAKEGAKINKAHQEWSQKFQMNQAEESKRRFESGELKAALDAEAGMVTEGRKAKAKVTAAAQAHRNAMELKRLGLKGKGGTPQFKDMGLTDSQVLKAMQHASTWFGSDSAEGKSFEQLYDQAANKMKGTKNPWHMGGLGPRAVGKTTGQPSKINGGKAARYKVAYDWAKSNITDWDGLDDVTKDKIAKQRMAENHQ